MIEEFDSVEEKLEVAVGQGIAWNPMIAAAYSHLCFVPDENLDRTLQVLRNGHVIYNPMFVDGCPLEALNPTIIHAVGHRFTYEWEMCVNYDHARYRVPTEHTINEFIQACGMKLLPGWTYVPAWANKHPAECLEFVGEVTEEQAINMCPVRYPLRPDGYGEDDTDEGEGEDGDGSCEDKIMPMLMHMGEVAKDIGIGVAALEMIIGDLIEPQLPWQSELRSYLTETLGNKGRSFRRPSRRTFALYPDGSTILPGPSFGLDTVTIVIDTSGSVICDPGLLVTFLSEIMAILKLLKKKCRIIIHSGEVLYDFETDSVDEVIKRCDKSGGTDFVPVFDLIGRSKKRPACVVWLTDLFGTWPDYTPNYPLLWVVGKNHDPNVPFGRILELPTQGPPKGAA